MDLEKYKYFNLIIKDSVIHIEINRPEKRNSFNPRLVYELCEIWDFIEENQKLSVGIIRSVSDSFFSSGADLKELIPLLRGEISAEDKYSRKLLKENLLMKFYRKDKVYQKPIIGVASGYCLAGGFELLLSCDFKLLDKNSTVGFPETKIGLIPAGGGVSRISDTTTRSSALEILINSEKIDINKLLYFGIINEITNKKNQNDILDSYIKKIINSNDGAVKLLMQNIDQLQSSNLSDKYKLEEKLLKKLLDE